MNWKPDLVTVTAIGIFLIVVMASAFIFGPRFESPKLFYAEEPLVKNKEFSLLPGENYTYDLSMNRTVANITYVILPGNGCTRIRMINANASEACVGRDGTDRAGYNSSLTNPAIILFKPWMLALREGWRWNTSTYIYYGAKQEKISNTSYRVIRTENYSGRQSFVVAIESGEGPAEYQWVDAEKRILVKMVGENYEIALKQD